MSVCIPPDADACCAKDEVGQVTHLALRQPVFCAAPFPSIQACFPGLQSLHLRNICNMEGSYAFLRESKRLATLIIETRWLSCRRAHYDKLFAVLSDATPRLHSICIDCLDNHTDASIAHAFGQLLAASPCLRTLHAPFALYATQGQHATTALETLAVFIPSGGSKDAENLPFPPPPSAACRGRKCHPQLRSLTLHFSTMPEQYSAHGLGLYLALHDNVNELHLEFSSDGFNPCPDYTDCCIARFASLANMPNVHLYFRWFTRTGLVLRPDLSGPSWWQYDTAEPVPESIRDLALARKVKALN